MSPDPGYSSQQVCKLTGATYRQLDYLCRTGIVRPRLVDAAGSGSARRFDRDQIPVIRLILRLRALGARHDQLADAVAKVDDFVEFDWLNGFLVVAPDGESRVSSDPAADVDDVAWVVALRPCLDLTERRLELASA